MSDLELREKSEADADRSFALEISGTSVEGGAYVESEDFVEFVRGWLRASGFCV